MGTILAGVATAAWLSALTVCDIRHRRLPNVLTLPGAVVVVAGACAAGRGGPAIAGAAALTALYLAVHLLAPDAMGAGDVKLAAGLGGFTGYFGIDVWLLAALAAPLLTAAAGVWFAVARRGRTVPHGPSMCAASLAAVAMAVV